MVQDNLGGIASSVHPLRIASYSRLRNGFDEMKCYNDGAYRIDWNNNNNSNRNVLRNAGGTVRFFIPIDGISDPSYGDVSLPKCDLYFSIPCFGSSSSSSNTAAAAIQQLSSKDGILSIRQVGWNTGWRRSESRMVGTFRVVPIDIAQQRDKY
jgi:hypothetical protein